MQRLIFLSFIFLLTISAENCNRKEKEAQDIKEKKTVEAKEKNEVEYKGRLEIKAICMNYTLKLTEGNIDTSKIVSSWMDETTKKTYSNVFALQNPCNFPDSIKQGDEFYFKIDTLSTAPCMVCMAYYPIPPKKLAIKIIDK
jgi:hypothetical protein